MTEWVSEEELNPNIKANSDESNKYQQNCFWIGVKALFGIYWINVKVDVWWVCNLLGPYEFLKRCYQLLNLILFKHTIL